MNKERTNIYAQGSIPEFENDGDPFDKYYLPGRALCYLVKDPQDLIVLPDHPGMRGYNRDLTDIVREIGLRPMNPPIFIPDNAYLLDEAIRANPELVEKRLKFGEDYRVKPYASTPQLEEWVGSLRLRGFNIEIGIPPRVYYDNLSHPAHRGGWGRHINNPDNPSFPEIWDLPYPVSFVGQGLEQTLEAYERVTQGSSDNRAFFKPVFSAGGSTLKGVTNKREVAEHYARLKAEGALNILGKETPIEIQGFIPDIEKAFCIHYDGPQIVTPGIVSWQVMDGTKWAGNRFNYGEDLRITGRVEGAMRRFFEGMIAYTEGNFHGEGGVDIAETSNPRQRLMIIEHNGQRVNGGHPAIALASGLGVEDCYITQKAPGEGPNCDLKTLWDELKGLGLTFNPSTRQGVFPMIWMQGSGILWAAGDGIEDTQRKLDQAFNVLTRRSYVRV